MDKYQFKPLTIDAIQWDATNFGEIKTWGAPVLILPGSNDQTLILGKLNDLTIQAITLVAKGDYIIKNVDNNFWLIKGNLFGQLFNKVA
jgi:hypothetical protein